MSINIKDCNRSACDNNGNTTSPAGATRCISDLTKQQVCSYDQPTGCYLWSTENCGTNESCIGNTCGCPGCLSAGQCQLGNTEDSCGSNGKQCTKCEINQRCKDRSCEDCDGCWDDSSQCQEGKDKDNCGTGGVSCVHCIDKAISGISGCEAPSCPAGKCVYQYGTLTIQEVSGVEEVVDSANNLLWKRQIELNPPINKWDWAAANNPLGVVCTNIYRLPKIDELEKIIYTGHGSPSINTCAFPGMPKCDPGAQSWFWSSTEEDLDKTYVSIVDFCSGYESFGPKNIPCYVRCVRSAQ
jgi:hypothetical protein